MEQKKSSIAKKREEKSVISNVCLFMGLLKSTLFEFFFLTPLASSKPLCSKKSKKTLILAFEANSALSRQNGLFSFSKISNNRDLCLKKVKPPHL